MSTTIKCKICGDTEFTQLGDNVLQCRSCRHKMEKPKDNAILMERANNIRFESKDFDEAAALYEEIIRMTPDEAEAYWGLVLCRFGIEYVKDPNGDYLPTCHRTVENSILDDGDYKMALAKADSDMLEYYISQAKTIEEYQAKIKQIAQKEKPYDVFISFKATENGVVTPDSLLAQDIYYYLTKNLGLKVFFSKITLKDKAGQEFEPIIYAALNSATVMVVVGTNPEYINSVWVKNEWSRFCRMISENRGGKPKYIIPALHGMRPEELPTTLASNQAIDLSELGSKEKLCSNIDSLIGDLRVSDEKKAQASITMEAMSENLLGGEAHNLCGMGFQKLEAHDFAGATEAFEKALGKKFTLAEAYWGKFLAANQFESERSLSGVAQDFTKDPNYLAACKYANEKELARYKKAVEKCYRNLLLNNLANERKQDLEKLNKSKQDYLKNLSNRHNGELQSVKDSPLERSRYYDSSILNVRTPSDTENLSENAVADFKEYASLHTQKNTTNENIKNGETKIKPLKKKFGNKFIDLLILIFSFLFIYAVVIAEPAPYYLEGFLYEHLPSPQEQDPYADITAAEIYFEQYYDKEESSDDTEEDTESSKYEDGNESAEEEPSESETDMSYSEENIVRPLSLSEIESMSKNNLIKIPDFVLNFLSENAFNANSIILIIASIIVSLYALLIMIRIMGTDGFWLYVGIDFGVFWAWVTILGFLMPRVPIIFDVLMIVSIVQFAALLIIALIFKTRTIIVSKKLSDDKRNLKRLEKNIEKTKTRLYSYKDAYANAVTFDVDEINRNYDDKVKAATRDYDEKIAKCNSRYDKTINEVRSTTNVFEAAKLKVEKEYVAQWGIPGVSLKSEDSFDAFSKLLVEAAKRISDKSASYDKKQILDMVVESCENESYKEVKHLFSDAFWNDKDWWKDNDYVGDGTVTLLTSVGPNVDTIVKMLAYYYIDFTVLKEHGKQEKEDIDEYVEENIYDDFGEDDVIDLYYGGDLTHNQADYFKKLFESQGAEVTIVTND